MTVVRGSVFRLGRRLRLGILNSLKPETNHNTLNTNCSRCLGTTPSFQPRNHNAFFSSPASPFPSPFSTGQRRTMFIQTQSTPNPESLMFHPGKPVMDVGSADFPNPRSAMNSPLAKSIFTIDGITRVFFGSDFVTVTKSEDASWEFLKPEIFAAIMDFYSSGEPLFLDSQAASSKDTAIHDDDSETVAMIKELLETRIRPTVQDDGGDIVYCGFDPDTGIVKLKMQGACSGCPSSSVTLKSGIENMLMHYVPEVTSLHYHFVMKLIHLLFPFIFMVIELIGNWNPQLTVLL
ncbi:iron-sulfur cluster scaffold protein NFU4 [Medicago truncatula]|uniref:Iron-sulfur cluster scaffold protein NFU4 n=1 Tax=Medicago truncatula TaxID=3880 RepID=A0A072V0I3_MEDTR|nr:iron-sulfur cluster scaffold protein NFU4 [Medicago truncatula]